MRKRSSINNRFSDDEQEALAADAIKADAHPENDAPIEKNLHAAALGRLGGRKGGPARAAKLTAEQRSEIARKAAQARWHSDQQIDEGRN